MTVLVQSHIVSTPDIAHGAPRIDGHRIRVQDVVSWHVWQAMPIEEVAQQFDLTFAQIHAALAFYYDNRAEIDAKIQADIDAVDEFRLKYGSKLPPKLRD